MSTRAWAEARTPGHRLVVTTVRVAERMAKAADRFLKPYRLTLAQFNLLALLVDFPEGLAQSRVGTELVVSRANITGLVRRTQARGLCRTAPDPADARVKRVQITPAGARLLRRIEGPYFREIARLTRGLGPPEARRLTDALNRIEQAL